MYVEKPISHNIRESRLLVEAAAHNTIHVQHGTQCRSTGMMIEAIQLLQSGIIGDVLAAKCWNVQRRGSIGRGTNTAPPIGLDYDTWVGPAPMIPYRTNRVHNRWTMWYHFGVATWATTASTISIRRGGALARIRIRQNLALGGKFFFDDDSEFPDTQQVTFEFAERAGRRRMLIYEQRLWSSNYPRNVYSGAEFYGTGGLMFLTRRGKVEVRDKANAPRPIDVKPEGQNDVAHVLNFVETIRAQCAGQRELR